MTAYKDFKNDLLLAIYRIHRSEGPDKPITVSDAVETARQTDDTFLLSRFVREFGGNGFLQIFGGTGHPRDAGVIMNPSGFNFVEDELLSLDDDEDDPGFTIPDELTVDIIASGRIVGIDHNSATYKLVNDGISKLREEIRIINDINCSIEEKERLLFSLDAAKLIWKAAQLKYQQIEIGIIMVIEDASAILKPLGKAIGVDLIVDALKALIKHCTGISI